MEKQGSFYLLSTLLQFYFKELVAKGSDGQVESSYLQKFSLSPEQWKNCPLQLIKMLTRYGEEDLLWANNVKKSHAVFKFVVELSRFRAAASEFRKGLAFLNSLLSFMYFIKMRYAEHLSFRKI